MSKSSNFIWDIRAKPYHHIRIVDDSFRIISEQLVLDKGQKWYIHKKSGRAYLIPNKYKMVKRGSKTEITYNYKDALPLIPDVLDDEQKQITDEIKKNYQDLISKFNSSYIDTGDIKKKVKKPITYNHVVDPIWLFEALTSKFTSDILDVPKNKWEEWIPYIMILGVFAFIALIAFILTSQPHIIVSGA